MPKRGSCDRTAVRCQLLCSLGGSVKCSQMPGGGSFYDRTVLWRAREVFADARVRAEDLFVIVRQSDASSMFL
jgi:hypothetical protein